MKNKIDLSEIARIAQSLRDGHEVESSGVKSRKIAVALEALPKMHEALMVLSTDMVDYLQIFDSPKVGLWAKKCNSILQQFETPEQ